MDAFGYANKLVSYVADCHNKFGHYFPPALREYFNIHVNARRTISDLIISCRRVGAFVPIRRVPIISPLQSTSIRQARKILVRPSIQKSAIILPLEGGRDARLLPLNLSISKHVGIISQDIEMSPSSIRSAGPFLGTNPLRHNLVKIKTQTHPIGISRSEQLGSIPHSLPSTLPKSKHLMTNLRNEVRLARYHMGPSLDSNR